MLTSSFYLICSTDLHIGKTLSLITKTTILLGHFHKPNFVKYSHNNLIAEKRPPMILSHISSMDVISPQTAKLECTIEGHPTPNIIWYKDNKEVKIPGCSLNRVFSCAGKKYSMWIKRRTEKRQIYDVFLTIKKTEYPRDHGVYRCEASNDGGTAKADIFVNVQGKGLHCHNTPLPHSPPPPPPPYVPFHARRH